MNADGMPGCDTVLNRERENVAPGRNWMIS